MKITNFLKNCWRVLKITRKPSKEEYLLAVKITGIGIIVIGLIGFSIFLAFKIFGIFG